MSKFGRELSYAIQFSSCVEGVWGRAFWFGKLPMVTNWSSVVTGYPRENELLLWPILMALSQTISRLSMASVTLRVSLAEWLSQGIAQLIKIQQGDFNPFGFLVCSRLYQNSENDKRIYCNWGVPDPLKDLSAHTIGCRMVCGGYGSPDSCSGH